MRILIADDDALSRRILEATLLRLGHEVLAVVDGREAEASLRLADAPPMAILDWMMPGADGLTVCRTVRAREGAYVYLILLTARDRREDMLAALDAGADDFLSKPFHAAELHAKIRSGARVLELQASLLRAQEALRIEATSDPLTGLWNRRMILDQLGRELKRAAHERRPLALMMADIDHFKRINDAHGHPVGDTVLSGAAHRMRAALREYDFIGRYGGEEFMFVLPGCNANAARQVAERVRARIAADPFSAGDVALSVTVSLGVALTETCRLDRDQLVAAADQALYGAKALGRDRVELKLVD
jgi:diguanylate cyclase (GGDEF)-like protein